MLLGVGKFGPKWVGKFERNIQRQSDSPFFGQVAVLIPNAYAPLNPNYNPLYFPSFEVTNTIPNRVYEAWMRVWDRSGGLIHEAHVVSVNNQPINPVDLAWDGKWQGQWVANGFYDVDVDYQSCQVAPSGCVENEDIIGPGLELGDIGNGASIKPFHPLGQAGTMCTPDPLSCDPPASIKNYGKCSKFHCNNSADCHHKQVVQIAN